MRINERRSLWRRMRPYFTVFDGPLAMILFLLLATGLVTLYSAGIDFPGRVESQVRNIIVAFVIMWIAANVPPQTLLRLAVPLYTVGIALLVAVFLFGTIKKGARRWLHVGIDIQPSEIMKIGLVLALARFYHGLSGKSAQLSWWLLVPALLILAPVALVAK
ncbi:MAG TPA: FtsW/RodA/SpoVE family cell cycle protein, partial [Telluria sp.]|nr:FtsW/RodA/SpoVE family cell cycle protein [Telluria sp.]